MESERAFPLFGKLATEIRLMIWELAILEENRDRLVPISKANMRIHCLPNLKCSSCFLVAKESREVAIRLYPMRIPVLRVDPHNAEDVYLSISPVEGNQKAIYINLDLDIIMFELYYIVEDLEYLFDGSHKDDLAWVSAEFSLEERRGVRRVLTTFASSHEPYHIVNCPHWPEEMIQDALEDAFYDRLSFPDVQIHYYSIWTSVVSKREEFYDRLLNSRGYEVRKWLEETEAMFQVSGEDVQKARDHPCDRPCVRELSDNGTCTCGYISPQFKHTLAFLGNSPANYDLDASHHFLYSPATPEIWMEQMVAITRGSKGKRIDPLRLLQLYRW
ncbi:hypothetical protein F5Y10DRAFT_287959 [Nemania abortiva]|nr:hypothetical protein F5Y10DRAFT_287959 [Nemania abortiva]